MNLAHVRLAQGRHAEAVSIYENCLKTHHSGRDSGILLFIALAEYSRKKYLACIDALKKAIHLTPSDMRLWFNLALTLEECAIALLTKPASGTMSVPAAERRTLNDVKTACKQLKKAGALFTWLARNDAGISERKLAYDVAKAREHAKHCGATAESAQEHQKHEERVDAKLKEARAEIDRQKREHAEHKKEEKRKKEEKEQQEKELAEERYREQSIILQQKRQAWVSAAAMESEKKTKGKKKATATAAPVLDSDDDDDSGSDDGDDASAAKAPAGAPSAATMQSLFGSSDDDDSDDDDDKQPSADAK